MSLSISATNTELPLVVNVVFQQTLLRNAKVRAPYFIGTESATHKKNAGNFTAAWRRINTPSASTSAISELQTDAAYMQGRTPANLDVDYYTAAVSKYGNFVILNEEVDLVGFNGQDDKIFEVMGINAGQSLNQIQRDTAEDSLTQVYVGAVASAGVVVSGMTLSAIKSVVNTLDKNSATTFTPMTTGSGNIGTAPILPAYWGLTHPDVAVDIAAMAGFKGVETYAGQTNTVLGEFGTMTVAGKAIRWISTEDASVSADGGGTKGSTGLNGTSDVDLYQTAIYGRGAIGSVGFGQQYPDGTYMAGDDLGPIEIIHHGLGSGGSSDPYNEIATIAWKAWHGAAVLNADWGRTIVSGSTKLNV